MCVKFSACSFIKRGEACALNANCRSEQRKEKKRLHTEPVLVRRAAALKALRVPLGGRHLLEPRRGNFPPSLVVSERKNESQKDIFRIRSGAITSQQKEEEKKKSVLSDALFAEMQMFSLELSEAEPVYMPSGSRVCNSYVSRVVNV